MNNTFEAAFTTCRRRVRVHHMHFLYLATATPTGSITDSTAQDDIPEKAHQYELKIFQAYILAKKLCPWFSQCNGYS